MYTRGWYKFANRKSKSNCQVDNIIGTNSVSVKWLAVKTVSDMVVCMVLR